MIRFLFSSSLIILLFYPLNAALSSTPNANNFLETLQFETSDQLSYSEKILKKHLAFDPGNPEYHFELSRVYAAYYDFSKKNEKRADEYLDLSEKALIQVLNARPEDAASHFNLGVVYKRRGQMEKARGSFQKVLGIIDPTVESHVALAAWMQMGATYQEQGFYDDARVSYERARAYHFNHPEIVSAIEDTKRLKKQYRANAKYQRVERWPGGGRAAAEYGVQATRIRERSSDSVTAVLPFMGAYVFGQMMDKNFLGLRSRLRGEDDE